VYNGKKPEKLGHSLTLMVLRGSGGAFKMWRKLSSEFASIQVLGRGCAVDEGSPRLGRKLTLIEATP
jgi:hypothetical protein